ncbi:ErmCL family antibiotic resistance leader peptide [Pseudogracilibacillus auburnensis]
MCVFSVYAIDTFHYQPNEK